jgi:hypothetical protein
MTRGEWIAVIAFTLLMAIAMWALWTPADISAFYAVVPRLAR